MYQNISSVLHIKTHALSEAPLNKEIEGGLEDFLSHDVMFHVPKGCFLSFTFSNYIEQSTLTTH